MNKKLMEVVTSVESLEKNNISISDIEIILKSKDNVRDYAFIIHDKDDTKPHYHIAIRFKGGQDSKYVAEWFGIAENFVNSVKGRWSDMLKYLTHENAPGKYQYSEDEVVSNYEWTKDKKNGDNRKEEIINGIVDCQIKEYNIYEYITGAEYVKYANDIKKSL